MSKLLFAFILPVFLFAGPGFGQAKAAKSFTLAGVVRDASGTVLPGLGLRFTSDKTVTAATTDENGEFLGQLSAGEWVLTSDIFLTDDFRVFLTIGSDGLNPNYLELIVDWGAINCVYSTKPVSVVRSSAPTYPAAAKAVHAVGEVEVKVLLAPDGTVLSANAVRGHPLLRKAAENAAAKFVFAPAEGTVQRNSEIIFVFLMGGNKKPGLERISFPLPNCPFRLLVFAPATTIESTESDKPADPK